MGDEPKPVDDKWAALFRIVETHHQQHLEKHERVRKDLRETEARILAALATSRDRIDADMRDHEEKVEARIREHREQFVLRVEFLPIRNGFYGVCLTFFAGFVGFLWKVIAKQ